MAEFSGRTVLVTGGSSGIGLATAQAFAAQGARVMVTGRDVRTLGKAKAVLGDAVRVIRSDASKRADAIALAESLAQDHISLDVLFINAGVARFCAFAKCSEALWDQTFDINVKGPYFQIQALLPLFNHGAAIVINGSINAHLGVPGSSVYAASKAALISLARTLSAELLPHGVRVNVISPGPVATRMHGADEAHRKAIAAQVPLGRLGTADEIAATVLHLSATKSAFIVGSEIIADGGMSRL